MRRLSSALALGACLAGAACAADRMLAPYGARVRAVAATMPGPDANEAEAAARRLPPCPAGPASLPGWTVQPFHPVRGVTLLLPPAVRVVERNESMTLWAAPDSSVALLLMRAPDGEGAAAYSFDSDSAHTVHEGTCAQLVGGRLARSARVLLVKPGVGPGAPADTMYAAVVDVVLAQDVGLFTAAFSRTRAGRDSLGAALAGLRVAAR